ncbi:hypothetical protein [Dyadobacter bucti]|uniref:hypothetical protein n=1 Tax=Dyadobacter bucti TaxID=2572203 RepID=UPI00110866F2|nr:hypothetical protein [Dyadobacter bucti]
MSISPPPPKKKMSEEEIDAIINRGGKAASERDSSTSVAVAEPVLSTEIDVVETTPVVDTPVVDGAPDVAESPAVGETPKTESSAKDTSFDPASTKSIKLIMTAEEMEVIKKLRDKRPARSRSRKISISVHDWVIEAVQEKIERERRKYSVQ